jgi:hypothetical protein
LRDVPSIERNTPQVLLLLLPMLLLTLPDEATSQK